jgi:hypothetical protein
MRRIILAAIFCFTPLIGLADAGDERVVEMWQCELKDGQKMEDVQANNTKWLAMTRKEAASDDVRSYALSTVVGDLTKFVFVDTYPHMAAWSAAKSAEESAEGKAIEATFEELMECTKNRLYNSTEH